MTKELIIYGLAKDETRDYMESLLACFPSGKNDAANVARVKAAASVEGWHSFRVATFSGEAPNFAAAVNI
jgi:hypothetical protein